MNEPHEEERAEPLEEYGPRTAVESMNTPQAHIAALRVEVAAFKLHSIEVDKRWEQINHERNMRLDQRFEAQEKAVVAALQAAEKAVNAALAAAEKAVMVAETNSEKWRSNANEWRGAMDDRERRYVMRESHEAMISAMQKEINILQSEQAVLRVLHVTVQTVQQQVTNLQAAEQNRSGKGEGMEYIWAKIIAIVSALGAVGFGIAFVAK